MSQQQCRTIRRSHQRAGHATEDEFPQARVTVGTRDKQVDTLCALQQSLADAAFKLVDIDRIRSLAAHGKPVIEAVNRRRPAIAVFKPAI